jgi:hypothetical protein
MNPFYNILAKLNAITDTPATPVASTNAKAVIYESVEPRGSIAEAVNALEAEYNTFKNKKVNEDAKINQFAEGKHGTPDAPDSDAIARRKRMQALNDKQEDDAANGDRPEKSMSATRNVKGTSYGNSPEDHASLDETADGGVVTKKGNVTTHKGKKYGGEETFANKGAHAKDIMDRKSRYSIVDVGDEPDDELAEAMKQMRKLAGLGEASEFGSKNFANAANLKKAAKAKQMSEGSNLRNHPIYTNEEAWNQYKKELDEEALSNATNKMDEFAVPGDIHQSNIPSPTNDMPVTSPMQELDEISKLAGLPSNPAWHENADWAKEYERDHPDQLEDEFPIDEGVSTRSHQEQIDHYNELVNKGMDPDEAEMIAFTDEGDEEVDEGNEFTGALAAAKATGSNDFEVAGNKYTVKEDVQLNIVATGEDDAVNLIRKLSGLDIPQQATHVMAEPESAMSLDGEMGIELGEDDNEPRDIEWNNSPHEQTAPVRAAMPSGNDMHRIQRPFKPVSPGGNPMAPMAVSENKDATWDKYAGMLKALLK